MTKYYISFDTKELAPNIRAVTVELKHEVVSDMHAPMPINLRDHPLYPELVQYVWANHPEKYLRERKKNGNK